MTEITGIDYGVLKIDLDLGAIPLETGLELAEGARVCSNCKGARAVYVFIITGGPFYNPTGIGARWLDIDEKPGWYEGHIKAAHCPKCVDPFKSYSRTPPPVGPLPGWEGRKDINGD